MTLIHRRLDINDPITPWKQTNSWLQTVLLGFRTLGGHWTPEPSQKLSARHPLSSLHCAPTLWLQSRLQQGPWLGEHTAPLLRLHGLWAGENSVL